MKPISKKNSCLLALLVIVIIGAFFRFSDLGYASMGHDVMEYYKAARAAVSPFELLRNPGVYGINTGLWAAAHNLFLQLFRLDVTFVTIRLLDAFVGTLTILAIYALGRELAGRLSGLLMALFIAIHPVHIQMSRESYPYVAIVLGVVLMIWAIVRLVHQLEERRSPDLVFYSIVFVGFSFTTMNLTSIPFAGVVVGSLYLLLLPSAFRRHIPWIPVFFLTGGFLLISLLIQRFDFLIWGFDHIFTKKEAVSGSWNQTIGDKKIGPVLMDSLAYSQGFLFGRSPVRYVMNALILVLAGWRGFCIWKRERIARIFVYVFAGIVAVLLFALLRTDHPLDPRFYVTLLPFFAILLSYAAWQIAVLCQTHIPRRAINKATWCLCFSLVLAFFLRPAFWSMKAEGNQCYKRISEWSDNNLPKGSVVLCDHWLPSWNHFLVNPVTNLYFSFTVPNEPPSAYKGNEWRRTAVDYLTANPFSAYFEQKFYWNLLGAWEKPQRMFYRKKVFIDEATLSLGRIGLAYRGQYALDVPRSHLEQTLYYNTDADVIARAKREGRRTLRGFGEGWRYLKPWQPMQGWPEPLMQALWVQAGLYGDGGKTAASMADLQKIPPQQANGYLNQGRWADYRIPGERSALRLFNLTEQELSAKLTVTGIALSGNVRCMIGDEAVLFPQTLLTERRLPVTLKPGENELFVAMPMNQFMLVHDVRLSANDSP